VLWFPVLVEEFVKGPEFTVGVLGNEHPSVLGIMQIEIKEDLRGVHLLVRNQREWQEKVRYHCPLSLTNLNQKD